MKKLLNNIWLKFLALLVGVLVWFHVVTEKTYNYEVTVPVTDVDLRDDLTLATLPPDSITVVVSAKGKQLVQSGWRERGVRINISKLPTGRHTLYLTPENVQLYAPHKNVVVEEVLSPIQWEIEIDPKGTVELPVTPNIIASPDDGFAVSSRVVATPARAKLTGPRSIIKVLSSILTEQKELTGLRNSVTIAARLTAPAGMGMKVEPETVLVRIDVVPVKTRVYENLPIAVYNLPPDYSAKTNPPAVRVELTGPPEDIDLLNKNALTVAVDYRDMTKEGMAGVSVDCPANFKVKTVSVDSVRILATRNARTRN